MKFFGDNEVFKGIDFWVIKGEVVCVIGLLGLGKLMLLCLVNFFEELIGGKVLIEGIDIIDLDVDIDCVCICIGMVF